MSTQYYTKSILGCSIPVYKLYLKEKIEHNHLCQESEQELENEIFIGKSTYNGKYLGKFKLVERLC